MHHLIRLIFGQLTNRLSAQPTPVVLNTQQTNWLIRSGLLPCAHYLQIYRCSHPEQARQLEAALLSFRLLGSNMVKIYQDISQDFTNVTSPLVPLKGMDVCLRYYPEPWLRPMRDIDILVDKPDIVAYQKQMLAFGFKIQLSPDQPDHFYASHHHLPPLYHPQQRCWLEIHTGLFSLVSPLGKANGFQPEQIRQHLQPDPTTPHRALLKPEFLLVYIAAHWAEDLKFETGALPLLDIALIINQETINWPQTLRHANHPLAAGHLLLALALVNKLLPQSAPDAVIKQLKHLAPQFNRLTLRLSINLLHRYMLDERPLTAATQNTVPLFVEQLIKNQPPFHNLFNAIFGLIAPHHGRLPFWRSVSQRLASFTRRHRKT